MLGRIKTSLIRLFGRVKKMVSDLLLQFGSVSIPLGMVLAIFSFESFHGWIFYAGLFIAWVLFMLGIWAFQSVLKWRNWNKKYK